MTEISVLLNEFVVVLDQIYLWKRPSLDRIPSEVSYFYYLLLDKSQKFYILFPIYPALLYLP